jgi:hypothetical protein
MTTIMIDFLAARMRLQVADITLTECLKARCPSCSSTSRKVTSASPAEKATRRCDPFETMLPLRKPDVSCNASAPRSAPNNPPRINLRRPCSCQHLERERERR